MNKYLKNIGYTADIPQPLVKKARQLRAKFADDQKFTIAVLDYVDDLLKNGKEASSFEKSRFISVGDIISKRQNTCGSRASLAAALLRLGGLPTKLIDGFHIEDHGWIEVKLGKNWQPFDPTCKKFRYQITKNDLKIKEYRDWSFLEKTYKKGQSKT